MAKVLLSPLTIVLVAVQTMVEPVEELRLHLLKLLHLLVANADKAIIAYSGELSYLKSCDCEPACSLTSCKHREAGWGRVLYLCLVGR
jgi:hypothetical protein